MSPHTVPNTSGIYKITCTVTGKFYIGSSIDLQGRQSDHFGELRRGIHINPKLQNAFNKYGEDAFIYEVLELVLIPFLIEREQYYLDKLKPFGNKGFNINLNAASRLGMNHTPESREKNRQAHLGKTVSPETRKKLQEANLGNARALGNKLSPETRAQMSQARMGNQINLGRKHAPETIEKIRGYEHTPEQLEKMREASTGRTHTPESRAKMSQSMLGNKNGLGKIPSAEKREKISKAHLGRKHTPEQTEQHRQAMTGRKYDSEVYASRMKTYIVTSPDGTEYVVTGIRQFARDHNLNNSHLIRVAKGEYKQHKGWTVRYL